MVLRNAVVTGGSKGIGRTVVKFLAQEEMNIAFTYNNSKKQAEELLAELGGCKAKVFAYQCDVSKTEDIDSLYQAVIKDFGKVDILVNNAGVSRMTPFLEMTLEEWDDVFNINLRSVFYLSSRCARVMMESRWGRIINIGSIGGERLIPGVSAHYAASKAGLSGLTKAMAKELSRYNILVNCVAPGLIETEMSDYMNFRRMEMFKKFHPLKRLGTPEEVAEMVLFLASDKSSYITGETFVVAGGLV